MFNANEIFNIGIQIEKNGEYFYHSAAQKTDDIDIKNLFKELAGWEKQHIEIFEKLKASFPDKDKEKDIHDPENLTHLYLKAVADNEVFVKGKELSLDDSISVKEILKQAIEFEKDSVVLYTSMKGLVGDDFGKRHIDKLITEEINHIGQLTKKFQELHI
ncbi:MAG: ferritin family protein [Fibrobacter sp.]|nr:ferritin family protein [Fibrobacter sp.]